MKKLLKIKKSNLYRNNKSKLPAITNRNDNSTNTWTIINHIPEICEDLPVVVYGDSFNLDQTRPIKVSFSHISLVESDK